jgi:hypothetical protein
MWRFEASGTQIATNTLSENAPFDGLLWMDFDKTLADEVAVSSVTSVTVETRAGGVVTTEVTFGTPMLTPDHMGVHIPTVAITPGQYVVSITVVTTDLQTVTRKGYLTIR